MAPPRLSRRLVWLLRAPLLAIVAAALAVGTYVLVGADGGEVQQSPTPTDDPSAPLFVAVGDSFISGEGARSYLAGTNTEGNSCHRANTGYPFLVATALEARLVNATCSGAVAADFDTPQYPESSSATYGGVPQLDALTSPRFAPDLPKQPGAPEVVLLSVFGNDAGFGEIVRTCLDTDCLRFEPRWMANLEALEPTMERFYPRVRAAAGSARVLVMPYPQPFVVGDCVSGLSEAESRFLLERFLPRLNLLITWEAQIAGLEVVDTREAFAGARDCEPGVTRRTSAMNTLDLGRVGGGAGDVVRGSFHPRELGHQLLARAVLDHLARPAVPDPLGCEPFGCPPGPPPGPPAPPPGGDLPGFPAGAACAGDRLVGAGIALLEPGQEAISIPADDGTPVCWSLAGQRWESTPADRGAARLDVVELSVGRSPSLTVVHRLDEQWRQLLVVPDPGVEAAPTRWWERYSGLMAAAVVLAVALFAAPAVLNRRRSRHAA